MIFFRACQTHQTDALRDRPKQRQKTNREAGNNPPPLHTHTHTDTHTHTQTQTHGHRHTGRQADRHTDTDTLRLPLFNNLVRFNDAGGDVSRTVSFPSTVPLTTTTEAKVLARAADAFARTCWPLIQGAVKSSSRVITRRAFVEQRTA